MPDSKEYNVTDTQLLRVIDAHTSKGFQQQGALCMEHGTKIAKLETKFEGMDDKLDKVLANQEKQIEKQTEIDTKITKLETEKKVWTGLINGISGIIGAILGAIGITVTKGGGG